VPNAAHASTADSATNATNAANATAAASAPIAKVTYVSTNVALPVYTTISTTATASCPSGANMVGGGASIADKTSSALVEDSYPNGKTGWTADFQEFSAPTTGTVYAICAPAASTAP
jgi:hypothetical protein